MYLHFFPKLIFTAKFDRLLCYLAILGAFFILSTPPLFAIEISDVPLDTQLYIPPPNVMLIWDNSLSMDSDFMTPEPEGLFSGCCYLFPESPHAPHTDFSQENECALNEDTRPYWRSQWYGYNKLYYNPDRIYIPWPSTSTNIFENADLYHPWSHPMRTSISDTRVSLADAFMTVPSGVSNIVVPNAHYYIRKEINNSGTSRSGEAIYLVCWRQNNRNGNLDWSDKASDDRRLYLQFKDDGDNRVEANELIEITDEDIKSNLKASIYDAQGNFVRHRTDKEDLQNFANWFSYYRKREFTAKAAVAKAIVDSREQNIGIYAVNNSPRIAVQPVHVNFLFNDTSGVSEGESQYRDRSASLIDGLYGAESNGGTHLRRALYQVGAYFDQAITSEIGPSPINTKDLGGQCQRNYAVVITDGFWNGDFSMIGNVDNKMGPPYNDPWSDTLADIAAYLYETDLAPELSDLVPAIQCDDAVHQHLVTHTVSFGINGTINLDDVNNDGIPDSPSYDDDPCYTYADTPVPPWPQPIANSSTTVDDLWHAAVNGRGLYLSAEDPQSLTDAISDIIDNIGEAASTTGLAVNGTQLTSSSVFYQTRFRSDDWTGDLFAFSYGAGAGQFMPGSEDLLWQAAPQFQTTGQLSDQRRIITYGGPWRRPTGVAFQYNNLSSLQRTFLGSDLLNGSMSDKMARQTLDFIRGEDGPGFRRRSNVLGDIVHCTPVLVTRTLFVGANDGMLHAFDADTGKERFAYVPNLVFNNLKALADPDYKDHHRFYVDATPYAGEVVEGEYQRNTYLIGGLGKGGKGYYCLHLESRHRDVFDSRYSDYQIDFSVDDIDAHTVESDIAQIVKWEYPRPDPQNDDMDNDGDWSMDEPDETDPDIGYSFGQGYIVNANTEKDTYRAVAIFGNGYNSSSGKAILYVLEASTGRLLRKIDTGEGGDNGLSTPALIDVDLDRRVDYVYAGDLKGNLWKFDLTSSNPMQWGIAYGEDGNGDGVLDAADGDTPMPVFRAPSQSITGRPDIMAMSGECAPQIPGYMVIFGTGKFLGQSDRLDTSQQSIYGIWDYGDDSDDSEYLGSIEDRTSGQLTSKLILAPISIASEITQDGHTHRVFNDSSAYYTTIDDDEDGDFSNANNANETNFGNPMKYAGWFFDFPMMPDPHALPGERVTADVAIRGGTVVVTSFAPATEFCNCGGISWLYILNGCGNYKKNIEKPELANLPRRYDKRISDHLLILKDGHNPGMDKVICNDQTGRMIELDFLGERWGKVFWRQNYFED